jgi:hypothetical protein
MFKNSNSDSDTEAGHTRSGRAFREVHIANLFKQNYGDEVLHIIFIIPMIINDVNLYVVFRGVSGMSS